MLKKLVSMALTLCLIAGGIGISGMDNYSYAKIGQAAPEAAGGGASKAPAVSPSVTGLVTSTASSALYFGLDMLSDYAENENVSAILSMAERCVNSSFYYASKTFAMVQELNEKMDQLTSYTINANQETMDRLNDIEENQLSSEFNKVYTQLSNDYDYYAGMNDSFAKLSNALTAYTENPSAQTKSDLQTAYAAVCDKLENANDFATTLYGDTSQTGLLKLLSPYSYSDNKIKDSADITDKSEWGGIPSLSAGTSFMERYHDYLIKTTDLESNIVTSMQDTSDYALSTAYLYLQAYRFYTEYNCMNIAADTSLSESEKRVKTDLLWDNFYSASNDLFRAINQMYSLHEDIYKTYMRDYDVKTELTIKNYKSSGNVPSWFKERDGFDDQIGWDATHLQTIDDIELKPSLNDEHFYAYQFKLASEDKNTAYAIRTSSHSSSESASNMANAKFDYKYSVKKISGDTTVLTPDVMNYIYNPTTNGYQIPIYAKELDAIVSSKTSYEQSKGLIENLTREFALGMGSANVFLPEYTSIDYSKDDDDKRKGPDFILLRQKFQLNEMSVLSSTKDMHTVWANVSMNCEDTSLGKNEVTVNTEGDIGDCCDQNGNDNWLYDKELSVILTGQPTAALTSEVKGSGSTSIIVNGNDIGSGKTTTVYSGTSLVIKAKPDEGNTLKNIKILSADGKTLLEDYIGIDSEDNTVEESMDVLDGIQADENGYYVYELPVPYQDFRISVEYAAVPASALTYSCQLNDAEDTDKKTYIGVSQFANYTYQQYGNYHPGESIIVSVTGYDGNMPAGLTISGASPAPEVTDITEEAGRICPSERVFKFTMPAADIEVTPQMTVSYNVSVAENADVTTSFENLGCSFASNNAVSTWKNADEVAFREGDVVTISFKPDSAKDVDCVHVYYKDKYDDVNVSVIAKDNTIRFYMPAHDVTVSSESSNHDSNKEHTAVFEWKDSEKTAFTFTDEKGNNLNISQTCAQPGSVVYYKTKSFADNTSVKNIIIQKNGEGDDISGEVSNSFDMSTGTGFFLMPDYTVILSSELKVTTSYEDEYFAKAVQWAYSNGITYGTGEGDFSPYEHNTRAQMITFLWRAAGSPEPGIKESPFQDVSPDAYYYKAVLWGKEKGIVNGISDTSFGPDQNVSRAQTVSYLYRFEGMDTLQLRENPFTDIKEGQYFYDSVLWAYDNDITKGITDTLFGPDVNCLRCQVVTFLYRYFGNN